MNYSSLLGLLYRSLSMTPPKRNYYGAYGSTPITLCAASAGSFSGSSSG